jgi:hypothetical protein
MLSVTYRLKRSCDPRCVLTAGVSSNTACKEADCGLLLQFLLDSCLLLPVLQMIFISWWTTVGLYHKEEKNDRGRWYVVLQCDGTLRPCDSALFVPTRLRPLELEHVACLVSNHVTLQLCTTLLSERPRLPHGHVLSSLICMIDRALRCGAARNNNQLAPKINSIHDSIQR